MAWIESVPNVSEGRRAEVIDACAAAIRSAGAWLLDVSADAAHHRSVYTMVGTASTLTAAILELVARAVEAVDLRDHVGVHPRLGAVDVVPFIPLEGASMADAVDLARRVGQNVAERFHVPVYLYEEAALRPERRRLEAIRRGGFEALAGRMQQADWAPDFGPSTPHPTAGATIIGARWPLIAYNVTLDTDRLDVARRIARAIRESSGGLPAVKAMGVPLVDRGIVQVSTNLTNYHRTPIVAAFDAIEREARREGVHVLGSELIGLAPADALSREVAEHVKLAGFEDDWVLERRIARTIGAET